MDRPSHPNVIRPWKVERLKQIDNRTLKGKRVTPGGKVPPGRKKRSPD